MKNIILSIHPKFVEKILSGEKNFEYRKKLPKDEIEYILIYETVPIQKIVAIGMIDCIISDTPKEVWEKTYGASGIDKTFYDSYFMNSTKAYAIKFKQVLKLDTPLNLSDVDCNFAPQSYSYFKGDIKKLLSKTKKIDVKNRLIFLGGVHGVGKSTFTKKILSAYGYSCISASELIKKYNGEVKPDKTVKNIDNNQMILLSAINDYQKKHYKVVIDGHFCILDNSGFPQPISPLFFKQLRPEMIIVLETTEEQLKNNLANRVSLKLSIPLHDFIQQEHIHAQNMSSELDIPIKFINPFDVKKELFNN